MDYVLDLAAQRRLGEYFSEIGSILNNVKRRASFATYAMGLLGDGERKSVEPISARACADAKRIDAHHQRLLHFLTDSEWSDRAVRCFAARYATTAMIEREPILAWIVDDTGGSSNRARTPLVFSGSTPARPARSPIARSASASASRPAPSTCPSTSSCT